MRRRPTIIQPKILITRRHIKTDTAKRLQQAASLEFKLLEGIEHPGILRVQEYQQHDHGPALVYEHDPLAERLDHYLLHKTSGQPLALDTALPLIREIAEAVRYAHAKRLYLSIFPCLAFQRKTTRPERPPTRTRLFVTQAAAAGTTTRSDLPAA